MQNYHRHTYYSNIMTPDSGTSNEDYAKRACELGHKILCSLEHGWQGYYFETFELAKKYNLKCVIGAEVYWVKDRQKEYPTGKFNKQEKEIYSRDRSNHHMVILAKTNYGRECLNDILSEANITGYFYKPRVDLELLLSLPPDDVLITTACIAFDGYDDIDDIILQLYDHFGSNFMLEIQYHNTDKQKKWNKHLLELHNKYGIDFIVGLDSHYITKSDEEYREYILEAKDIHYEDEEGWYMDYPSDEEVIHRFEVQGIFNKEQIKKAMNNTDICLTFDDYDDVPIFNKNIKLPTLYPNLSQEEKDKKYSVLISQKFKDYCDNNNVVGEEYNRYFEGVKAEVQTYKDTGMTDYPLIDYAIVKDAVEHGGLITDSGRGSAVGFMTNTLCGFSKVDRFKSTIKLYPERFISTTRILETKSLPDIDLNVGTVDIFEDAQKRVLGEEHVAPMIAFGTLQKKAAFKLYARAKNMDFDLANNISAQISEYEEAYKHEDDETMKEMMSIKDFVDKEYWDYIDDSEEFLGIVSDKKKAPSAYLLYQGNIRREIGLIKCKSESTKKEYITCVIDGRIAEEYKFLKNDILKVDVVLLIEKVFNRIGIEHFDVNTLIEKVNNDKKVWDLYANGFTLGLNQVEKDGSKHKCMNYKPQNIAELSAFVAAIRPGFKSMYNKFETREDFSWGIDALDNLIRTKELPVSFLFFQEQVMALLNYAGFPMDECYGIIKAIAKKHPEKVRPLKSKFIEGFKRQIIKDELLDNDVAQSYAEQTWQIVNDNCGYGFNCVSGSTRIIRGGRNNKFNPTVEEMYKIRHDKQYAKETGHISLHKKYNTYGYGTALSMCDDYRIRPNRIVSIKPSGIRQTYKIQTETGCSIICTDNHKFPTLNGEVMLKDLKVGDKLFCMDKYKHKYFDTSFTDGNYVKNYPKKGQIGFQHVDNGATVVYDSAIKLYKKNKCECEICHIPYNKNIRFELHHKDMNRHNNNVDNYQWLCCSCHKKIHYTHGRTKRYENGIESYLDKIVSIEPQEVEMVYDIAMDDPYHNFISENGLVTSNSAHAYCMALDSLYQAWQKAHYPYEFYEVLLQHYSDKGNKDKVALLKKEMKEAFDINEGKYKFRADNRKFTIDKENQMINPALSSIKGLSNTLASYLYSLKDKTYNSFLDFLIDTKKNIRSNQLQPLIAIGYFSEFGEIKELQAQYQLFKLFYGKSVLKKDKLPTYVPEYLLSKYCKETAKQFSIQDNYSFLAGLINSFEYEKTTLADKIRLQFEHMEYISDAIPSLGDEYYFVQDIKNNIAVLCQLNSTSIRKIKFRKRTYNNNPFDIKDIIKIKITQEKKWRQIDKKWVQIEELEDILSSWNIVRC